MMSLKKILGFVILSASCLSLDAVAVEKRYVSDKLFVQMRSGPSIQNRILKVLPSGEHLIYLSEEEDFTQVRTDKGQIGWVSSQYLVKEPIAKEQLILATQELEKLKTELADTQQQRDSLQAELTKLSSKSAGTEDEAKKIQEELDYLKSISKNAIALDKRAKDIGLKNQELSLKVETLTAENHQLKNDNRNTYLLYGGSLILFGIIGGLILPNLRAQKRSTGGWA